MTNVELLRLPRPDEFETALKSVSDGLAAVERVQLPLSAAANRGGSEERVRVELSAERAWQLTRFARDLRIEAEQLTDWANDIDEAVEFICSEARDA